MTMLTGQAGVWRVAAELALRGIPPSFPGVDYGYDLILEHGVRIQVKAARLRSHKHYPQGVYLFHLMKSIRLGPKRTIIKDSTRKYSDDCEFVVLCGLDENRFWVTPAADLDHATFLSLGPASRAKPFRADIDVELVRFLKDQGWTVKQIAEHYDIDSTAIRLRLNGAIGSIAKYRLSDRVRECEDRWELIDGYLKTFEPSENSVVDGFNVMAEMVR